VRILVLSINYWPDETGIAAFNVWRCEYLAARGHQVTICTGPPYYPEWRVPEPYRTERWRREERNGVTILRSSMFVPHKLNTRTRVLHEASFVASSFVRALLSGADTRRNTADAPVRQKPDLIVAVSPPLGLAVTASALARLWRVPFVYDVEDLQPDAAVELGMMKPGKIVDALYRVERLAYERAALVSTITEGMRQRIIGKGIDASKVALFPPRADSSLYNVRRRANADAFRERYGLQGKLIVSHSGNMGVKQGLEVILHAAVQSRERSDIHYVFIGDGAMRTDLQLQARALSLQNVLFLPLLHKDEFEQMLAATDISLITQQRVVSNIVFPSKTVTLLCAGCPVVASVNAESEVARAVRNSGAGVVVEPENSDALWHAIEQLAASPERRARMSAAGRKFAEENWDERRTLPRMEQMFMDCVDPRHDRTISAAA